LASARFTAALRKKVILFYLYVNYFMAVMQGVSFLANRGFKDHSLDLASACFTAALKTKVVLFYF
jgi:hypothetical protein